MVSGQAHVASLSPCLLLPKSRPSAGACPTRSPGSSRRSCCRSWWAASSWPRATGGRSTICPSGCAHATRSCRCGPASPVPRWSRPTPTVRARCGSTSASRCTRVTSRSASCSAFIAQYVLNYTVSWPIVKLSGSSFHEYEKPTTRPGRQGAGVELVGDRAVRVGGGRGRPARRGCSGGGWSSRSLLRHVAPRWRSWPPPRCSASCPRLPPAGRARHVRRSGGAARPSHGPARPLDLHPRGVGRDHGRTRCCSRRRERQLTERGGKSHGLWFFP